MKYIATVDGQDYEIEINQDGQILANGERLPADFMAVAEQSVYSLIFENRSYEAYISPGEAGYEVLLRGQRYTVEVEDERARLLRKVGGDQAAVSGEFQLKSPMPGLVIDIPVEKGTEVKKGDDLIILESMKMQNELKSPRDGTVIRINAAAGDSVQQDAVLLVLE
ncbi:MAG: acetyl-CoA carboxylase biotin carboxyl carrier protein subunit [Anaerolineales bacterium]